MCSMCVFYFSWKDIDDVTKFVHPGTPVDSEATQRGTPTYLFDWRIEMFSKPLKEENIIYTRYTKSGIKSYIFKFNCL